MIFRLRLTAWYAVSVMVIVAVLMFTAHRHLDEELRSDRWDRTHPQFPEWIIHGSYTDDEVQDILGELMHVWMWVGIPLVLGSVAAGYLIALRSVRPIRCLNRELGGLDVLSLNRGVRLSDKDPELALLVDHINAMLERIGRSYSELAEFSARVAHELRTPLTVLRMRIESAAPDLPPDFAEEIQEEVGRLTQLVERSLLAAKAEGGRLQVNIEPVDVSALLADLRESYDLLSEHGPMKLDWRVAAGLRASSDAELLRQVFHNLIGNAIRHGRDTARIHALSRGTGGQIIVRIVNLTAPGGSPRAGAGLGLRLVRSITGALAGTALQIRHTPRTFGVQVRLPAA